MPKMYSPFVNIVQATLRASRGTYHPSCENDVKRRCIYAEIFSPKVGRCAGNESPFIQKGCVLLEKGLACSQIF